MAKPTVVLVHGAWHTPEHAESFAQTLRSAGIPTASGQLPSVDAADPKSQDVRKDVEFIRDSLLLPRLDRGEDVILLMHSYGGIPGGAAAAGLSKASRRANGLKGGVVGLIYMCACVVSEGDSLISKVGGQLAPWIHIETDSGQMRVDTPEKVFYNNVDEATARAAAAGIKKQAHLSYLTESPAPAWKEAGFDHRLAYIKCHQDLVIPIEAQKDMLVTSGLEWRELDLEDAGHSPFYTHKEEMARFIDQLASEWAS